MSPVDILDDYLGELLADAIPAPAAAEPAPAPAVESVAADADATAVAATDHEIAAEMADVSAAADVPATADSEATTLVAEQALEDQVPEDQAPAQPAAIPASSVAATEPAPPTPAPPPVVAPAPLAAPAPAPVAAAPVARPAPPPAARMPAMPRPRAAPAAAPANPVWLELQRQAQQRHHEVDDRRGRVEPVTRWLRLRCGHQAYALELLKVQEVVLPVPLLALRGTGHAMLGIMNLRGQVVPVLDLGLHLGAGAVQLDAHTRIVVLEEHGEILGLRVSAVEDVVSLSESQIEPPDTARICQISNDLFRGVARLGQQPMILLDAARLLQ